MEQRIKPIQSVRNFRDFGGYAASGGVVKHDTLFRSAHYHQLADEDVEFLNALDIRVHVDLRRPDEREKQPNKWPGDGVLQIATDGGREETAPHLAALQGDNVSADAIDQYMLNYYLEAPFKDHHIELFKGWFRGLLDHDGAKVVHCAAGKDRTGIICALTHDVLGVSKDDIYTDYLLTNEAVNIEKNLPLVRDYFNNLLNVSFDAHVYKPFMGVRTAYLDNTWRVLTEKHGSPVGYVQKVLGLTDTDIADLKAKYIV